MSPIPNDRSRPYVQADGPTQGFFVSRTWLEDPGKSETDPSRYVDSSRVPYLVFPGNQFPDLSGTGWKGDAGFAWHLANGQSTPFIVADRGGGSDARLGEASIAFYEALGGVNVNARNGSGIIAGNVAFVRSLYFQDRATKLRRCGRAPTQTSRIRQRRSWRISADGARSSRASSCAVRGTPDEIVVKLFNADAGATWLLMEFCTEDSDIAFGLRDLGMGSPELGSVQISELEEACGRIGLTFELDRHFTGKTLLAYARL